MPSFNVGYPGSGGATTSETPLTIKTKYESNPDTNAFTDAEQTKLASLTVGGGGVGGTAPLTQGSAEWQDIAIVNGDFETGDLTGWTVVGTAPTLAATPWGTTGASNGSWVATGGAVALAEAYQDITLGVADDSAVMFAVNANFLKDFADTDVSSVTLQVLDSSNNVLAENTVKGSSGSIVNENKQVVVPADINQATLRINIAFTRLSGTNNNCGLDNIKASRYVLSQYAVPVDYDTVAKTTPLTNAASWIQSGATPPASTTISLDAVNGLVSFVTEGAVAGVVPMRIENPDKRPAAGTDFDHVFMIDMALSGDFPWGGGIFIENSATQKYAAFGLFYDGRSMRWRWTDILFDSEVEIDGPMDLNTGHWPLRYYARLKRVGGVVQYFVSGNGLSWLKMHEEVLADFVVDVDRVGLFNNPQNQGADTISYVTLLGHDDTGPQPRAISGGLATTATVESGTSYTVVDADLVGGVTRKIDLPAAGNIDVPTGLVGNRSCSFLWYGVGQPTFTPAAGVTINSIAGNKKISAQYGVVTLTPDGTDSYLLEGDLTA